MEYRHELKYLVSDAQLAILRARLTPLMKLDSHQPDPRGYLIRSLYFDDIDNRFLQENMYGLDDRVKFRVRIYDCSDETIHLETKFKYRNLTRKAMCSISRAQCDDLIAGKPPVFSKDLPKPLRHLYLEMASSLLRPRIIVEYQRVAFVEPIGNVRVTFDRNIASSTALTRFFDSKLPLVPLLPPGQHILEVKYDELIPDYLVQTMDLGDLSQNTFSKYAMCRCAL